MRSTFPSLPRSSPRITRTVSPFETRIFTRSELMLCLDVFRFFAVFRCLSSLILQNLRRERDDLHVLLLSQLARYWSKDAGGTWLSRFVDDHYRVLVEPDVGAVLSAGLLGRPNDHSARDLRLLHGSVRKRVLHCDDDNVAQPRIPSAGSAEHADDER